jgi:Na+/proline symporter
MSSMDSGINSLSTVVLNDFIKPLRTTLRTEAQDVKLARILTLAVGAFAMGLAFYVSTIQQILRASAQFMGLFGGPIVALFLLGMLGRRTHFRGWLAGTIPAVLITYFGAIRHTWMVGGQQVQVHFIYYFPICFGITLVIGYFASLLIPAPLADEEYTVFNKRGRSAQ